MKFRYFLLLPALALFTACAADKYPYPAQFATTAEVPATALPQLAARLTERITTLARAHQASAAQLEGFRALVANAEQVGFGRPTNRSVQRDYVRKSEAELATMSDRDLAAYYQAEQEYLAAKQQAFLAE